MDWRGFLPSDKADDEGGLAPSEEDNTVWRQKDRQGMAKF